MRQANHCIVWMLTRTIRVSTVRKFPTPRTSEIGAKCARFEIGQRRIRLGTSAAIRHRFADATEQIAYPTWFGRPVATDWQAQE
jgi:hypothetical protein